MARGIALFHISIFAEITNLVKISHFPPKFLPYSVLCSRNDAPFCEAQTTVINLALINSWSALFWRWFIASENCQQFDRAFACLYNSDSVTDEKITALLEPFLAPNSLSPDQLQKAKLHLDLLIKWNAKVNLTAIRSAEKVVTRHFGESFFAARELSKAAPEAASAVDVGSGAGFPGLPIKLWLQEINLTLVESNQKKAAFLREAIRTLELENVEVKAVRAERLRSKYEIVTLRAVERFDRVLPVAFGLLALNAVFGLLIGSSQTSVAKRLLPGVKWKEPISIPDSDQRIILIGRS